MLILPAEADEALVGTATDRVAAVAAKHSGTVRNIERWGRRRFAYEIDDRNEGYYVVATFSAEPSATRPHLNKRGAAYGSYDE